MDEKIKTELIKQIKIITISQQTILLFIYAIILNYINVNKLRVELLDKLNNTNCADELIDTKWIPITSSIIIVYGAYIFLSINYSIFIEGINTYNNSKKITEDKKILKGLYESYLASAFVFVASIIRLVNIQNPEQEITF